MSQSLSRAIPAEQPASLPDADEEQTPLLCTTRISAEESAPATRPPTRIVSSMPPGDQGFTSARPQLISESLFDPVPLRFKLTSDRQSRAAETVENCFNGTWVAPA